MTRQILGRLRLAAQGTLDGPEGASRQMGHTVLQGKARRAAEAAVGAVDALLPHDGLNLLVHHRPFCGWKHTSVYRARSLASRLVAELKPEVDAFTAEGVPDSAAR